MPTQIRSLPLRMAWSQTALGEPAAKNKPNPTRYNLWMYQNFMIMEGMDALGEVTEQILRGLHEAKYRLFCSLSIQVWRFDESGSGRNGQMVLKPRHMWQCGMIAAFAEHHKLRPNPEFIRGMKIFDSLLEKTPHFDDECACS